MYTLGINAVYHDSAACLVRDGVVLAADGVAAEEAGRKAYTALMFGIATHELRTTSKPLWRQAAEIDTTRLLMSPGGYPVVEAELVPENLLSAIVREEQFSQGYLQGPLSAEGMGIWETAWSEVKAT